MDGGDYFQCNQPAIRVGWEMEYKVCHRSKRWYPARVTRESGLQISYTIKEL